MKAFESLKKAYLVGIKGVGMMPLGIILHRMGVKVVGSDVADVFPTDSLLNKYQFEVKEGFKAENIPNDIDLLITTGAHGGLKNPEVIEAQARNIQVLTHAQALGSIMDSFQTTISICGSHGKTTTSAIAAHVLQHLGKKGAHHVGTAHFSNFDAGGYWGKEYFVSESDEYVTSPGVDNTPRFMHQNPDYILCTNIDFDHSDVYKDLTQVQKAFSEFFLKEKPKRKGFVIYNADDENSKASIKGISFDKKISYGTSRSADTIISDVQENEKGTTFNVSFRDMDLGSFSLSIPGIHNIFNATAVITFCALENYDMSKVKSALASFSGAERRFQEIYSSDSICVYDDYAHHPREIEALILASRAKFPNKRLTLVFQPHTFTRTAQFEEQFISALSKADITLILDIFGSAREQENESVSSASLVEKAQMQEIENIQYVKEADINEKLSTILQKGDIVITAGAGNVYKYHENIINIAKNK